MSPTPNTRSVSDAATACAQSCATCSGSGATACLSCSEPLFLDGTICKTTCPASIYPVSADNTCQSESLCVCRNLTRLFQDMAKDLAVTMSTDKLYPVSHEITGDFTSSSDLDLVGLLPDHPPRSPPPGAAHRAFHH